MAERNCWHCGAYAVMTPRPDGYYEFDPSERMEQSSALQATFYSCPGCLSPSIGIAPSQGRYEEDVSEVARGDQAVWLPLRSSGRDFAGVPDDIAAVADEAHRCHSVKAYRGAIVLARAVLEATCKDKGIREGSLFAKIDALHEQDLINALVQQEAHEIRIIGNDMAHGDVGVEVSSSDADDVLALMGEVLDEVYQRPARVAARQSRRSGGAPTP